MEVHINLWGVLLSAIASMIIGSLYYADKVLGKEWKQLSNIDLKRFEKSLPRIMPLIFIAALVTAYVVAYFTYLYHTFYNVSWIRSGLIVALVLWLGVSVTSLFIHNSLEQRPKQLTVIALGNRLLSILAMGLIIGWLHP